MVKEKESKYNVSVSSFENKELSHKELQEAVAEIGKLQFYYTELEYPIELPGERKNLDVVWKREISGVPTFAFEIELSGALEKALERLKFAYKKWNSRPRIIISKEDNIRAFNIINLSERDFKRAIRVYETEQIVNLLNQKRNLKRMEQMLDLY